MDVRKTTRYPSHGRAQVALPDGTIVAGHTQDISLDGIAILLDSAIHQGIPYLLRFEIPLNGTMSVIVAKARFVYGVFANSGSFRAGFSFTEKDAQRSAIINRLAAKFATAGAAAAKPAPGSVISES